MKQQNKTERIEVRTSPEQKIEIKKAAASHQMTVSEYMLAKTLAPASLTHEAVIENCLLLNHICNIINRFSLSPKEKEQIIKELNNYG